MYRKILLWLVSKELKKDDLRKKHSFLGDIFSKSFQINWDNFNEDTAYSNFYLLFYNIINSFRFSGLKAKNGEVKDFKFSELEQEVIMSGLRHELIAYYAYPDEDYWFKPEFYITAEAKYLLGEK